MNASVQFKPKTRSRSRRVGPVDLLSCIDSIARQGLATLPVDETRTMKAMAYRLSRLRSRACTEIGELMHPAPANGTAHPVQPWGWCDLLETPTTRCGVLTVFRGQPIPLHDHPGSHGVVLVLAGAAAIRQYDLVEPQTRERQDGLVHLARVGDRIHREGDTSWFGPRHGNAHRVDARTPICVLLELMVNPYPWSERAWYFPAVREKHDQEVILARRVLPRGQQRRPA